MANLRGALKGISAILFWGVGGRGSEDSQDRGGWTGEGAALADSAQCWCRRPSGVWRRAWWFWRGGTGRENCRCRGTSVRDKDQTVVDLWTWSGASSLVLRFRSRPLIRGPTREGGLGAVGRQETDKRQATACICVCICVCVCVCELLLSHVRLPRHQRCHSNALHARCVLCAVLYVCNPRLGHYR